MATVLRLDGTSEVLSFPPENRMRLAEMRTLVGGYIEVVRTLDDRFLVIDEEGKLKNKPVNIEATKLYKHGRHDPIVGVAILFDTLQEMNGPDEEEES